MRHDRARGERRWREKVASGKENLRLARTQRAALQGRLDLQGQTLESAQSELGILRARLEQEREAARVAQLETAAVRETVENTAEERRASEVGLRKRLNAADLGQREAQARVEGLLDRNSKLQEQGEQLRRESWRAQAARQDALAEVASLRQKLDGAEPHPLVAAQLEGQVALERRERELETRVSLLESQAGKLREDLKDAVAERDVALKMKQEAYASVQDLQNALLSQIQESGNLQVGELMHNFRTQHAGEPPSATI